MKFEFRFEPSPPVACMGDLKWTGDNAGNERQQMKTYTSSYTPAPFVSLANVRKLDLEKIEQAIDATLTGLKGKTEFAGLVRSDGEKGEFDAITETVARMPHGTVRDCLVYFGNVKRAEKAAKRVGGVVTLGDFPATLTEWLNGFAKPKPKSKQEAKEAIEATRAQLESNEK